MSHSQIAVAAAETLRRHTRRLLLRQQRRCSVALSDCCCGSRDVAASHSHTAVAATETLRRQESPLKQRWSQRTLPWLAGRWCSLVSLGKFLCSIVQACSSSLLMLGENVAVDFLSGRLSVDGRIYAEFAPQMERCVWRVSSL